MRSSIHLASLALAAVAMGCATGCATPIDVVSDPSVDLSRYRTWSWVRGGAILVEAPESLASDLSSRIHRAVTRGLGKRGFLPAGSDADFFVTCRLAVRRRQAVVEVPRAPYLFSSMDSSASYWIEGSNQEIRTYQDLQLEIGIRTGEGPVVWHAATARRVEAGDELPLPEVVDALLERLPRAAGGAEPAEPRPEPQPRTAPPEAPAKGTARIARSPAPSLRDARS